MYAWPHRERAPGAEWQSGVGVPVHRRAACLQLTFQAAGPPEARVCHHLLILFAGLILIGALDLADATRVQPVVRPYSDGHEAEGSKGPHRS